MVDQVFDTEEIVVKPLSRHLKKIGVYAGATIMGDGRVALILDAEGLVRHSQMVTHTDAGSDRGGNTSQWSEEGGGEAANAPRQEAPSDPAGPESPSDVEELPW